MPSSVSALFQSICLAFLLAWSSMAVPSSVRAYSGYVSAIPNGASYGCSNCHVSPSGGGTRTAFGEAFRGAGYSYAAIALADADGDGYANGFELGDPSGIWVVGATPSRAVLSNPGVANNLDDCAVGMPDCHADADCADVYSVTGPAYTCTCRPGFLGDGVQCNDVDECAVSPDPCSPGSCMNEPGTYSCACPAGTRFVDGGCVPDGVCTASTCGEGECVQTTASTYYCDCFVGYSFDGVMCSYVGCSSTDCGPNGLCWDYGSSVTCSCNPGYEFDGFTCADIDECAAGYWGCGPGTCVNFEGTFTCACPPGYEPYPGWDGQPECRYIDPCLYLYLACNPGYCQPAGIFGRCVCPVGYVTTPYEDGCVSIDSCAYDPSQCCAWYQTWNPTTSSCDEIDDCAGGPCSPGTCIDDQGTYACVCPSGFEVLSAYPGESCVDRDECATSTSPCDATTESCVNEVGGYRCDCAGGRIRLGGVCSFDPCAAGTHSCSATETCVFSTASPYFTCVSRCGNGVVDVGESCDDGTGNSDATPDACRSDCMPARCGDGVVDTGEGCDDGTGMCCFDAGVPEDGSVPEDAGATEDASVAMDAGEELDASTGPDAGFATDAGGDVDAGNSADAAAPLDASGVADLGATSDASGTFDGGPSLDAEVTGDAGLDVGLANADAATPTDLGVGDAIAPLDAEGPDDLGVERDTGFEDAADAAADPYEASRGCGCVTAGSRHHAPTTLLGALGMLGAFARSLRRRSRR